MAEEATTIPMLPCPNCAVNILEKGFHNTCSETVSLREDNRACRHGNRLYLDHDEHAHETIDHECDTEAFCRNCDKLLPWALYEIRRLDGSTLVEAEYTIADLLKALATVQDAI